LEVQYADYAVWQRKWVEGEVLRGQAEYWKQTLDGAPELLELPADHARPAQQDYAGASVGLALDRDLTSGLRELSRRHGITMHMTLLAGWAGLLSRLSGQQDVLIGTPAANRGRIEIEDLIGFFVNMLALRLDLSGSPTVAEALERVKKQSIAAQQRQDIPFEQVVEMVQPVRSLSHSPLFQVMFAWQNVDQGQVELPGIEAKLMEPTSYDISKFDLALPLKESGDRIVGRLEYATALFDGSTVERYLGYFRRLLEGMVKGENQGLDRLPLLGEAERHQLLYEWNATAADYPREKCVQRAGQPSGALAAQGRRRGGRVRGDLSGTRCGTGGVGARGVEGGRCVCAAGPGPSGRAPGLVDLRQPVGGSSLEGRDRAA
jgi:hypothetical protein